MKKIRMIYGMVFIASFLFGMISFYQNSEAKVLATDVSQASDGCVLVGIEGSYKEDASDYVKRVNEIRQEACSKGYPDPRDPSRALTQDDYVPIQWSKDLQYLARIRAAEAIVNPSHTRTNGKSCFSVKSQNDVSSSGEVLAWGGDGISLWYGEKADWVSQNDNAVTGHYTSMINPGNIYMGISYFISDFGSWSNCYAGEFSSAEGLDTTPMGNEKNIIQIIEVSKEKMGGFAIYSSDNTYRINKKKSKALSLKAQTDYDGSKSHVNYLGEVSWSSSDSSIASIDAKGKVTGKKYGTAVIRAAYDGTSATKKVTVQPVLKNVYFTYASGGKKKIRVSWNKGSKGITGYQIQYSTNYYFKKNKKTLTIKGRNKTSKVIKKLKKKKLYYIRIRSYIKDGKNKYYSSWNFNGMVYTK